MKNGELCRSATRNTASNHRVSSSSNFHSLQESVSTSSKQARRKTLVAFAIVSRLLMRERVPVRNMCATPTPPYRGDHVPARELGAGNVPRKSKKPRNDTCLAPDESLGEGVPKASNNIISTSDASHNAVCTSLDKNNFALKSSVVNRPACGRR